MLTALSKLVWNKQKSTCTNFFKYQGKMFLSFKMFWCLSALPYCFFLHIFEGVKFLLTYNLTKQNWH